jgi:hypothetical protein
MSTDIFYVTVIEDLKGVRETGEVRAMIFFADTVSIGEYHIVAAHQREGSSSFSFTSPNSLFSIDQRDEIMEIINANR